MTCLGGSRSKPLVRMGPKSISGSSPIPNKERISCARASASNAHFPARVGNSSSLSVLPDRKSVVSGKSVSVRVDLGGRRIIKKKTQPPISIHHNTSKNTDKVTIHYNVVHY